MLIKPFAARRPRPGLEREIAAPPYDVLTREEALGLSAGRPGSILYVTRPEISFPPATPPTGDPVYAAARKHYRGLVLKGLLTDHAQPCCYLYEQQSRDLRQRGIVALFHVEDYRRGVMRRHENTRRDKERDRTRLLQEVGAQPGLVLLACRATDPVNALIGDVPNDPPWLYDFKAADGTHHRVMPLADNERVRAALSSVPVVYIADGHHRAAAAAAVAAQYPPGATPEVLNWFPAAVFPADKLHVFAYHRCVISLGAYNAASFIRAVRERFHVVEADLFAPLEPGIIRLLMRDRGWNLRFMGPLSGAAAADRLDVAVLQHQLLQPLLGINDPRTSNNLDFVGGRHARREIKRRLSCGEAAAAFMMAPIAVERMMNIADSGETMPPKSTWFEPKMLEGILIHDREK